MMNTHVAQRRIVVPTTHPWLRTAGPLLLLGLLASCAPASPSTESLESSIVLTLRSPQADFRSYLTYHLRPEIRQLTSDGTATSTLDASIASPLLDEMSKQLMARGYQAVDKASDADLAVEMVYVSSEWISTYCYSWWDPYYWGYTSWYYYPYYNCSSANWQTNTLATMMTDLSVAKEKRNLAPTPGTQSQVLNGIWFAGVSGIVISASDSLQKGIDGIDQAFSQSPYLTRQ